MFEFHGWAVIRHSLAQDEVVEEQSRVMHELKSLVASLENNCDFFHFGNGFNGMDSLTASGLRNHRENEIFAVYHWLADNAPGSYGLLYILNDESRYEDRHDENAFVVHKLARGRLEELNDPFLSPYIPTVEDPYDDSELQTPQ